MGFSKAQKQHALKVYYESGAAVAAEEAGCSRQSIYNWLRESIDTEKTPEEQAHEVLYQQALRLGIRRRLLERVDELLDRFNQPHYDYRGKDVQRVRWDTATSGDIRAYATAIGILIDKYRLESGEATSHSYHEGADDIDRRVAQLVAEMESRSQTPPS